MAAGPDPEIAYLARRKAGAGRAGGRDCVRIEIDRRDVTASGLRAFFDTGGAPQRRTPLTAGQLLDAVHAKRAGVELG